MKSPPPPPPPPPPPTSELDVDPVPSEPIALDWPEVLEAEVEEVDELALRDVPDDRRLVEARRADDMFDPLEVVLDAEFCGPLLEDAWESEGNAAAAGTDCRSRPIPERLPRSTGVIKETEFSAAVVPVRRIVDSTVPSTTRAVRTDCTVDAWREAASLRCHRNSATPAAITTNRPVIQIQARERRWAGFFVTTDGLGGGACGWTTGALLVD